MTYALIGAGASLVWALLCYVVDRSASTELGAIEKNYISPNPWYICVAAAIFGIIASFFAPHAYAIPSALVVTAFTTIAYADYVHKLIWEEITIPTLVAILGVQAYMGHGSESAIGVGIVGGTMCTLYFVSALIGKKTGTGDLVPVATLGAAFGPVNGMIAFGASAISILAVYPLLRNKQKEIPMGPGLIVGSLAGVILEQFLPKT